MSHEENKDLTATADLSVELEGLKEVAGQRVERHPRRIDEFVRKKLGYDSIFDLFDAFDEADIDLIAKAIHQFEREDQTSVISDLISRGHVKALCGIIQFVKKSGRRTIVVADTQEVFTTILEALIETGVHTGVVLETLVLDENNTTARRFKKNKEYSSSKKSASSWINPFILGQYDVVDKHGNIHFKSLNQRLQNYIIETGILPDEFDILLTARECVIDRNSDNYKFLQKVSRGSVLFIDKGPNDIESEPKLYSEDQYRKVREDSSEKDLNIKLMELITLIQSKQDIAEKQRYASAGTISTEMTDVEKKKLRYYIQKYQAADMNLKEFMDAITTIMSLLHRLNFSPSGEMVMAIYKKKYDSKSLMPHEFSAVIEVIIQEFKQFSKQK